MTSCAETAVVDPDLVDAAASFFSDRSTAEVVAAAEVTGLPRLLWSQTAALGFPLIGIPEEQGGAGGTLLDAVTVLREGARRSVPLPLLEHHLAAWLAGAAEIELPEDSCATVASAGVGQLQVVDGAVRGTLSDVAFAADVDVVVVQVPVADGSWVALLRDHRGSAVRGQDLAGQGRDTLQLDGSETVAMVRTTISPAATALRGRLLRAAQIGGALAGVSDLTRKFAAQRVQFGTPIAKFQAVQAHLVVLAQAEATVILATDRAAIAAGHGAADFEINAAKLLANKGAREAARATHQAHGAIGMTREYPLHLLTRRLQTWRSDHGTDAQVRSRLAELVLAETSLIRGILDDNFSGGSS